MSVEARNKVIGILGNIFKTHKYPEKLKDKHVDRILGVFSENEILGNQIVYNIRSRLSGTDEIVWTVYIHVNTKKPGFDLETDSRSVIFVDREPLKEYRSRVA